MSQYKAFIAKDGKHFQVSVCWDDNDPNRFITAPFPLADPDDLAVQIERAGYRLVSTESDNVGRGWAIVTRANQTERPYYDPVSRTWHAALSDDIKQQIRAKYPDAVVAGVA